MELAQCKYIDCEGSILVEAVSKASAIPKAPHHLALVAACNTCGRAGQYVVERSTWEEAREQARELIVDVAALEEDRMVAAAKVELDAVGSVNDLIVLWSSLPHPPLREGLEGRCACTECRRKRYGK